MWSCSPDDALVRQATSLQPGRALDLGCGPGAEAIWLAQRGWQVVAADTTDDALEQAARHVAEARVTGRVECQRHDLSSTFPDGSFDLVQVRLSVNAPGGRVLRAAASAVAPGGVLIVIGHARWPSWEHPPLLQEGWADHKTVLDALDLPAGSWDVQLLEVHQRCLPDPEGRLTTQVDSTLRVKRAPLRWPANREGGRDGTKGLRDTRHMIGSPASGRPR